MKQLPFDAILDARLSRRSVVTAAAASVGLAACARISATITGVPGLNPFNSIAPRNDDAFVVADGYQFNVVARWGDSLVAGTPGFDTSRMTNTDWLNADAVDAQHRQFGTNCDAVQYFSLVNGAPRGGSREP
jgi:secreted PhoX family phosphatase